MSLLLDALYRPNFFSPLVSSCDRSTRGLPSCRDSEEKKGGSAGASRHFFLFPLTLYDIQYLFFSTEGGFQCTHIRFSEKLIYFKKWFNFWKGHDSLTYRWNYWIENNSFCFFLEKGKTIPSGVLREQEILPIFTPRSFRADSSSSTLISPFSDVKHTSTR